MRGLIVLIVAVVGVIVSAVSSEVLRKDARSSWELEATNTASSLSGTLLGWLEESYAPISGLAVLIENSNDVTEAEFLNAYDGLEARATAFFLEGAAFVEAQPDAAVRDWRITYSTDTEGLLAPQVPLTERPGILDAVLAAKSRTGEIILTTPIDDADSGRTFSPVALSTFTTAGEVVVIGLVDYQALLKGLFEIRVPPGVSLRLSGRFPRADGPGPEREIIAGSAGGTLFSVPTRTVTAGVEMVVNWDFGARFSGGPSQSLGNLALVGGLAGTLIVSVFLAFLIQQNSVIMLRVDEATAELSEKEAHLRMALDNMPSGIMMIDDDMIIHLFNQRYVELYELPDDLLQVGESLEGMIRLRAERGDYGPGNPEELVQARLGGYGGAAPSGPQRMVNQLPSGRVLETTRNPTGEGVLVAITSDITEMVESQRAASLLREAIDTFPDMVILYDKDEHIVFSNDRYHEIYPSAPPKDEITNFTMEQLIRRSLDAGLIDNPLAKSDPEAWLQEALASRRDKKGSSGETRHSSGRIYFYRYRPTTEGGIILVQIDITKIKEAEAEVAKKEAQLRMAMENMPGAMVVVDKDLKIVLVNDSYRDFYGDPEGLVTPGGSMLEILRSEVERGMLSGDGSGDQVLEQRIESYRTDSTVTFEDWSPDGRDIQLTRTSAPDGHSITVAVDITERKQAERAAAEKQAQLNSILENINQGVVLWDREKRLEAWNVRYPQTLGIEEGILRAGMPLVDLTFAMAKAGIYGEGDPRELAERRVQSLWSNSAAGTDISFGDDRSFDVQSALTPDHGLVITYTDITERKKAERIIADAMRMIHESIQYASRIQRSVLPADSALVECFDDHFIIWEPKDVVGGDIYHLRNCLKGTLLMVIDCTGHGVPGAFMTMIATGALDQALIEIPDGSPDALLERINQLVKAVLGQDTEHGESDDGFECGLCLIDEAVQEITYAGARFELWRVEDGELEVFKGDKTGIGYRRTALERRFMSQSISYGDEALFYLATDGIVDQIGGGKRLAFGKRRLKQLILDYYPMALSGQGARIRREFEEYQHREERRDDVTLVAFKPKSDP